MRRRKWDAKTKAMIVIEGLKGKPGAELCNEHQISQAQYYQWRDQFLAHAPKAFEVHEQRQREARLARENTRLKTRNCSGGVYVKVAEGNRPFAVC
jgi:transposase-like protein